jgi:hypothetical protein
MKKFTFEETYEYTVEALTLEEAEETFQAYMESGDEYEGVIFKQNYTTVFDDEGKEL